MGAGGNVLATILHPSRSQVLTAALCLAAAGSVWGDAGFVLRAPLGFVLMGLIPGWLLARVLIRSGTATPEELGMAAVILSIPLTTLARVITGVLGVSGVEFVILWAVACAAGSILIPRRAERLASSDPVAWLLALALASAVVFPAAVNPSIRSWGDAMYHASLVHEILPRTFPAEDPVYFGLPLSYCWVFHIWAAALVDAMGVTSYEVFFWINGAMMSALALGTYRLGSLYWPQLLHRRLAPLVVVLGMNALGWLCFTAYSALSAFVGEERGTSELTNAFIGMIGNPTANSVTLSLIFRGPYPLSSFLYKYLCANTMATGLALVVAGFVLASAFLREGAKSGLVAFGIVVVTAIIIHPIAGVPAAAGFLVGFLIAGLIPSSRSRGVLGAAVVGLALIFAAPVVSIMSAGYLSVSEKASFCPSTCNLSALIQGLSVVIVPGLWGWWKLRQRQAAMAGFGAGFALVALAAAFTVDFPERCEIYTVYSAYLGVSFFAAGGIGAAVSALRKRGRGVLCWVLAGLVFLPSSVLLIQGFARDSRTPGSHGYPDSPDEIAVFDYLRDQSPRDAVIVDSSVSHHPPCSAYSHRRAFYGGYIWAELTGYPKEEMARRERAVVNLLFEPHVCDSTCHILAAAGRPVYIVAREHFPEGTKLRGLPRVPISDPIGKLESFPSFFEPTIRTPTIVVFRWKGDTPDYSKPQKEITETQLAEP